jgi:hypothetical protein
MLSRSARVLSRRCSAGVAASRLPVASSVQLNQCAGFKSTAVQTKGAGAAEPLLKFDCWAHILVTRARPVRLAAATPTAAANVDQLLKPVDDNNSVGKGMATYSVSKPRAHRAPSRRIHCHQGR